MSGIYIHIPFCKQACYYCDFHFSTSFKKKDDVLNALNKELILRAGELQNDTIETIYFGGGTPSILSIYELQRILNTVKKHYKVSENPEITLEANPDDLTNKKISELHESEVNRLSIGIQSFFEDDLKSMNRAHSSEEANKCLSEVRRHFDNITIDLIYGIPNMTLEKWHSNLQLAFDYGVPHISSYALTVEPKTALDVFIKKGTYPPIDEDLALKHFQHLVSEAKKQGFTHYEISNFGKPDYFSKHNTSYWKGKPYLGIGPSAHSFNHNKRSWNVSNNTIYIKHLQENKLPLTTELLTIEDRYNEYIMTGLRTIWGVSIDRVNNDFGPDFKSRLLALADKFIQEGLLVVEPNTKTLKTTLKGKFLVDGIASELFMI